MTRIETYLFFNGNCREAMQFYERALGGTLSLMTAKEAPADAQIPPGSDDRILHSRLEVDGAILMASDWMAPTPYPSVGGFSVSLAVASAKEAKTLFDKLADGGQVTMPFGEVFYSDGFGMLVDRFGTPWMVMAATNDRA